MKEDPLEQAIESLVLLLLFLFAAPIYVFYG